MSTQIHFSRTDERFCGSTQEGRRVSFDANEVTCPHCKSKDGFVLSASALKSLHQLGFIRDGRVI